MRLYIYLAAAIILVGSHSAAVHYGRVYERDSVNASVRAYQTRINALKSEVEAAKQQREVVYRDRIKIVDKTSGECMDVRYPDPVPDILHKDAAGYAGPRADDGL